MSQDSERALIIDFGSQVTQLIARRLRESGIYCEIHPFTGADAAFIRAFGPRAIILSGGPASVLAEASARADPYVFEAGIPVLGICYGMQTMMAQLGGRVAPGAVAEFGRAHVRPCGGGMDSPLLKHWFSQGIGEEGEAVWMSHGDRLEVLADGFCAIAASVDAPFAVVEDRVRKLYGVQFHPEVVHTTKGAELLRNFTHGIAGMRGDWTMEAFGRRAIESIRDEIGDAKVMCGLSGGVDSSVTAILLHRAIGDGLVCVFVDTGLLRAGEAEQVVRVFRDHYDIALIHADAGESFFARLQGVSDPEEKRRRIGGHFIEIFEHHANRIGDVEYLAQGTVYPDVIESVSFAGGPSVKIKSHHNVGGLPERMNLKLVEPLRELFKDEVRVLGRELGLPESMIGRHPFPGPGLAIRIPGEVTRERAELLRCADRIYLEEIREAGLYDEIWQAFAVLLPVRSVGVKGDARSYEHVLALRAVTSIDGMTADSYPFEHDFLSRVASRIVNETKGINRVVYDVTSKPPGTIEWE